MSNLWFNIRFGTRHFQFTRNWQISFGHNQYWLDKPEAYDEVSWFEVYCAFGRHFGI